MNCANRLLRVFSAADVVSHLKQEGKTHSATIRREATAIRPETAQKLNWSTAQTIRDSHTPAGRSLRRDLATYPKACPQYVYGTSCLRYLLCRGSDSLVVGFVGDYLPIILVDLEIGDLDRFGINANSNKHDYAEDRVDDVERPDLGMGMHHEILEVAKADQRRGQRAGPEVSLRGSACGSSPRTVRICDLVGDESADSNLADHSAVANS